MAHPRSPRLPRVPPDRAAQRAGRFRSPGRALSQGETVAKHHGSQVGVAGRAVKATCPPAADCVTADHRESTDMHDDPRWDPEMRAAQAAYEAEATKYPPIRLEFPFEPHRAVNDALNLLLAEGGPAMAESSDRWVAGHGRRILCRMHRPRTDQPLPVLVWFHGGGWVWSSVDTHDRLAREYAAAGDVAVVSVDYSLSPEAKFPTALEECAAVTA